MAPLPNITRDAISRWALLLAVSILVQACGVGAFSDDHERPADATTRFPSDALQTQGLEDPWGSGGRRVDAAQDALGQGGVSGQGGSAGGAGGSPGAG